MTLRKTVLCFLVVESILGIAADKSRIIEGVSTINTQLLAPVRFSHFRCDSSGNVYIRPYTGERIVPVVRISFDGKHLLKFVSDSEKDFTSIPDFWVADNGDVMLLAEKGHGQSYILQFDSDANYKGEIPLDVSVRASQLAVFPSGDYLIGGREVVPPGKGKSIANGKPFIGIFNGRGQLIKQLHFERDVKPNPKQPSNKADLDYADMLVSSASEVSDDGSIYFVRHTPSGPIYLISDRGLVMKTWRLKPPEHSVLSTVKVARETLAAEFVLTAGDGRAASVVMQIVDLHSGLKMTEYVSTPPLGPDFACYKPNSFKFIATDENGYITLTDAVGR
jgi:hypothetical protein